MAEEYAAHAEAIANLVAITNVDPAHAADLLANAGGDLELAVNDFFLGGEAAAAGESGAWSGGGPPALRPSPLAEAWGDRVPCTHGHRATLLPCEPPGTDGFFIARYRKARQAGAGY